MSKAKPALARNVQDLANHKFDSSKYILMKGSVSREATTGRLVQKKTASGTSIRTKPK